jgi:aromatic ring-cleaving dioxygenase
MRLKSKGGTLLIKKQAEISGYHAHVWYNKKNAITNIISLRNLAKQYLVTYDSDDKMFVVHWESVGKKNMEFRMHDSGIHYYDPRNNESDFITPVSGIQQRFTQRHINGAQQKMPARMSEPTPMIPQEHTLITMRPQECIMHMIPQERTLTMKSICPKTTPKFQECILPIRSQECLMPKSQARLSTMRRSQE